MVKLVTKEKITFKDNTKKDAIVNLIKKVNEI